MHRKLIYLLLLAGLLPGIQELQAQQWVPILEDYMEGPSLSKAVWQITKNEAPDPNSTVELSNDDALSFVDGEPNDYLQGGKKLRIAIERGPFLNSENVSFPFRSANMKSIGRYKHGKFEIRCKTPHGKGYWPAFFLYNDQGRDAQGHEIEWEEIDVFEMEGDQTDVWKTSEHYGGHLINMASCNYCISNDENPCYCELPGYPNPCYIVDNTCGVGGDYWHHNVGKDYDIDEVPVQYHHNFDEGFHTFTVEWYQNWIYYSVDGVQYRAVYLPFLNAMHIYFGVGVAGEDRDPNGNWPPYDSSTPQVAYMEVDYVKAWAPVECGTKTMCQFDPPVSSGQKHVSGTDVSLAGGGCTFLIDGGPATPWNIEVPYEGSGREIPFRPDRDQFYATATNSITIGPGFTAEANSEFHGRIVSGCGNKTDHAPPPAPKDEPYLVPEPVVEEKAVSIFPNPGTGLFHVDLQTLAPEDITGIVVSDYTGRHLHTFQPSERFFNLDLTGYAKGIYFVAIRTKKEAQMHKIVLN